MNKLVNSRNIWWCPDHDRYVLVVTEQDEVVGLNYMQGDELDIFLSDFSEIDPDLTKFYNSVAPYLSGEYQIDRINQAIWAYFDYKNNY